MITLKLFGPNQLIHADWCAYLYWITRLCDHLIYMIDESQLSYQSQSTDSIMIHFKLVPCVIQRLTSRWTIYTMPILPGHWNSHGALLRSPASLMTCETWNRCHHLLSSLLCRLCTHHCVWGLLFYSRRYLVNHISIRIGSIRLKRMTKPSTCLRPSSMALIATEHSA